VDGIKTGHTRPRLLPVASARPTAAADLGGDGRTAGLREQATWNAQLRLPNFDTASVLGSAAPVQTAKVYKGADLEVGVGTLEPVYLALPPAREPAADPAAVAAADRPAAAGRRSARHHLLAGRPLKTVPL